MRGRSIIWFSLITILVASATMIDIGRSSPATRMYADPPSVDLPPFDTFDLNIMIQDVTDLGVWEFKLMFDNEILFSDESMVTEGPFLSSAGPTMMMTDQPTPNMLMVGCMFIEYVPSPPSGSGLLATVTFSVVGEGSTALNLYDTLLQDINGIDITDYTVDDGYFSNAVPTSANLVRKSAWPEHHHFSVLKDEDHIQTLYGKVKNLGPNPAYIRVEFTVVKDTGVYAELTAKNLVDGIETPIAPGEIVDLSTNCWLSQETAWPVGKYYVNATAIFSYYGVTWSSGAKLKAFSFAVVT